MFAFLDNKVLTEWGLFLEKGWMDDLRFYIVFDSILVSQETGRIIM